MKSSIFMSVLQFFSLPVELVFDSVLGIVLLEDGHGLLDIGGSRSLGLPRSGVLRHRLRYIRKTPAIRTLRHCHHLACVESIVVKF